MTYELVIIGAGKTGLKSALIAKELGLKDVLIIDHEKQKGGFHAFLWTREDFHKENAIKVQSEQLPYEFWFHSTLMSVEFGKNGAHHQLNVKTREGVRTVETKKILFAIGSMEKPREGNQIAGTRPAGVMTSHLASSLLERHYEIGKKFVIFENTHYSTALANFLEEKKYDVTRLKHPSVELLSIKGVSRVTEIDVKVKQTGDVETYPCDTVIYSDGKIPCTFFFLESDLSLDREGFIEVDEHGQTNIPRVAAFGSCTNRHDDLNILNDHAQQAVITFIKA